MTQFRLNIDRPTKIARLHSAASKHPDCQPQDKKPEDGYWMELETAQKANGEASKLGLQLKYCKKCLGYFNTRAMKDFDPLFPKDLQPYREAQMNPKVKRILLFAVIVGVAGLVFGALMASRMNNLEVWQGSTLGAAFGAVAGQKSGLDEGGTVLATFIAWRGIPARGQKRIRRP